MKAFITLEDLKLLAHYDMNVFKKSRPMLGYGSTLLHEAARAGRPYAVRKLITSGAETETRNFLGLKPIDVTNDDVCRNALIQAESKRSCHGRLYRLFANNRFQHAIVNAGVYVLLLAAVICWYNS